MRANPQDSKHASGVRAHARPRPAVLAALVLLGAGALGAGACVQPPRVALPTPHGTVRAGDTPSAERLAAMLIDLQPRVRALLPGTRDRSTEVWLGASVLPEEMQEHQGVVALTELPSGRILIGGEGHGLGSDFLLAHELVHALMDESWDPLPAIMKEGLCDAIACRLVPEQGPRVRAMRMFGARFAFGEQQLDLAVTEPSFGGRLGLGIRVAAPDFERRDPLAALAIAGHGIHLHAELQDEDVLYGYGLLLVERTIERAGLDGLHALCMRARDERLPLLPSEWVLWAAGMDAGATSWRTALAEALGPAEMQELARQIGDGVAEAIVANLRYRYADFSAQEFLGHADASLGLRGGSLELPLTALPVLAERVVADWDGTPPHELRAGETQVHVDRDGLHLGLFGDADENGACTLQWVRVAGDLPDRTLAVNVGMGGKASAPAGAEVEACLRFRGGADGVSLVASRPGGFEMYRVEVHGVVVADLQWGLNVAVERDEHGWTTIACSLDPSLLPAEAVLYGDPANVVVSLRATEGADGEQRYPLSIPLRR